MKTMYKLAVMMVAFVALIMISATVYAKMDNRIELTAKKSYVFKTYLKDDDIKIQSEDGVVILTGTVSEESHKALAQETVASLPGVKSVDNRLEVKSASSTVNSDMWILDKVKFTLLFHKSVSAVSTEVNVKDGIVTLRGNADSQAQKELTTEYTKDVQGVKDVNNEMTVSKSAKNTQTMGENIDDASITAQVKIALLYHRSTSALDTKVVTKDGVVTLSGKGNNAAELRLATKLASDIDGVKSVRNRMTVG